MTFPLVFNKPHAIPCYNWSGHTFILYLSFYFIIWTERVSVSSSRISVLMYYWIRCGQLPVLLRYRSTVGAKSITLVNWHALTTFKMQIALTILIQRKITWKWINWINFLTYTYRYFRQNFYTISTSFARHYTRFLSELVSIRDQRYLFYYLYYLWTLDTILSSKKVNSLLTYLQMVVPCGTTNVARLRWREPTNVMWYRNIPVHFKFSTLSFA